jgi:glycosyltransferase involved in cell wall biosynthesis
VKILVLTQVLPYPLDAGPKVRAYYVLKYLAQQHHVTLASFVRAGDGLAAVAHLEALCEQVVTVPMRRAAWREAVAVGRSLAGSQPLLITRDHVPAVHTALAALVERGGFDAIHADQLSMAPYALAAAGVAARHGRRPHTVLDQHNAMYLIPRRMADAARSPWMRAVLRREAHLMARYEAATCAAFDRVVTVTDVDREALMGLYVNERPATPAMIPICVDPASVPVQPRREGSARVLFLGGMHWPPNADGARWFAQASWPRVRACLPHAEFWAVGKQPPDELAAPGAEARGLHAPGYVGDVEQAWANADAFVVPLRAGGGMRVKILDAWMRGLPVVSTTIGAEGLAIEPGDNLLLADTPEALAEAVIRVVSEPPLARRLSAGGRATVIKHYDWRTRYADWDLVYAGA